MMGTHDNCDSILLQRGFVVGYLANSDHRCGTVLLKILKKIMGKKQLIKKINHHLYLHNFLKIH